jgi:type IV pilus biogenesis protein CpaD/CtpE
VQTDAAPAASTSGQQTTPAPAPSTTGPAPVAAPLAAAPVAAAAATATASPSAQLDQVTAQVFPEVTGLVSRGPGTHRITLTLQPEQLGEVRVVMTMRQGAVHVRLAAGHDAQVSLAAGTAELGRLLEQAGIADARIVVRDLPAAATQTSPTLPTAANPDAQLGSGGERNQDQNARTRADHPATDGADHPRNHRSPVSAEVRPIHPVTGSRTAGVDLTI